MNKVLLLLSFLCLGMISSNAQRVSNAHSHRNCAAHEHEQKLIDQDPNYAMIREAIERETEQFVANYDGSSQRAVITIPIVFHIVHNGDAIGTGENISDALIMAQLDQINQDFRKLNTDAGSVPSAFQGLHADTEIEFCLAQIDPSGNPTTGIIRHNLGQASWTMNTFDASAKPGTIWDRDLYLNFWTARFGGGDSGLLGYAQFPGGAANTDGVVHGFSTVGSLATPNPDGGIYGNGRTATHEIGHWLNLRHIWGDSNCGNDFVADTPTQQTSNGGCPSFPSVTCSNGPNGDMFMNYMDYVQDNCMHMFTEGQKTRMLAALNGTRSSLLTAAAIKCNTPSSAPQIQFEVANASVTEGTSCGTKDVTVDVVISGAPDNTETISVNIGGASTATNNDDFTATISGITFTTSSTSSSTQTVTITIDEDAVVESDETVVLTLSLAGTSNATLGANSTYTLTVSNDDIAPVPGTGGTTTTTLVNADFEGGVNGFTTYEVTANQGFQLGSNATSGSTNLAFSGNTTDYFYINDDGQGQTADNSELYLDAPTNLDFSTFTSASITFDYAYYNGAYNGVQETFQLQVATAANTTYTLVPGGDLPASGSDPDALTWTTVTVDLTPYVGDPSVSLSWLYSDGTGWNYGAAVDNVVVTGVTGTPSSAIQVPTSASYANADLGPNQTVHFYDATTGNIMCTIENTTAHDYGCTQVRIERAGTANTFYNYSNNNAGSDVDLADKHFEVTPEFNNPTGAYNITLYYEASEVSGWASANDGGYGAITTMYKSSGAITSSSTLELSGTSAVAFGSDWTFTAPFSTGFSSFSIGAGTNPLPVELLSFTGKHLGEKGNQLDWITATEENVSHFEVERSIDGINFGSIGQVEARGNSATELDYDFLDAKPANGVNYYRLRMVDLDASFEYSNIISLKSLRELDITISPNPTRGSISLVFSQEIEGNTQIQLIDVAGRTVMNQEIMVNGTYELNMEQLTSGTYFIRITNGNLTFEDKILKL